MKRARKILSKIIALIIGVMTIFVLVACPDEPPHEQHNFGEWICNSADSVYCENREYSRECECGEVEHKNGSQDDHNYETITVDPTCVSGGYDLKTCKICGKTETLNTTPETGHEVIYDFDSTSHWGECKNCDYTTETASHTLNDSGLCTVCEQQFTYTEGLVFELAESGDYYVVAGYEGAEQDVVIPSLYDDKHVRAIGNYALERHTDITSISIPNSVTSIGYAAFALCLGVEEIRVSENHTAYKTIDGNLYTKDGKTLVQYIITKTDNEFVIPDGVTTIGVYALAYCSSLTSVTIPNGVTSIEYGAFYCCSSLESITIPNGVTSIGDAAFFYCSSLANVSIPDSVTSIGMDVFYNCENLRYNEYYNANYLGNANNKYVLLVSVKDVKITSCKINSSTKIIGYDALAYCYNLTSVTIPNGVVSIGGSAFNNCSSLTSVTIPNSVTSIGDHAFLGCHRLTSVTIPDGVTSIGILVFAGCSSLTSITIPDSITSIRDSAFSDCRGLTSIIIGGGVTSIGEDVFHLCNSLTSVYYKGSQSEWNDIQINEGNELLLSATIYYYSESEPQEEGNYWRYGANGEVEVWE